MPEIIAIHLPQLLADELLHAAKKHEHALRQTGVLDVQVPEADIRARTTTYEDTIISPEDLTRAIQSTITQASLLRAANNHPVFDEHTDKQLRALAKNHELALIGDLRTDTAHALLLRAGITYITHLLCQPSTHGISTDAQLRELRSKGRINAVISDQEALATTNR